MSARKRRPPPDEDLETKFRRMTAAALEKFEEDPEKALEALSQIGAAAGKVAEHAYRHPKEAKKAIKNGVLKGVARLLKEKL